MLVTIHIIFAFISIIGFFIRGILALKNSTIMDHKLVKILPHVVDTILLASGIYLATQYSGSTASLSWLWIKVLLILFYIFLGVSAFRFAKSTKVKLILWLLALFSALSIVHIAMAKPNFGF